MAYRHFNRLLFFRIVFLVLTAIAIGFIWGKMNTYIWIGLLVFVEIIFIIDLIKFLNKTNEQINYFIQAVKNDDTTLRFPIRSGNKIIDELHLSLNELNRVLQKTKLNSQIKERYFSEILRNIGTGVIVYNGKGFVDEINPAALELLGLTTLTHTIQLDRVDPMFRAQIEAMEKGQKQLLNLKKKNDQVQLISRCSVINLKDEEVKLLTLQDIRGELERKEIDSWIKLIRVLSHEIMNSLAPVTSITQSLKGMWKEKKQSGGIDGCEHELLENTLQGLDVIGERGEALIKFVQSYRILTRVPQPKIKEIVTFAMLDSLNILISPFKEGSKTAIKFHYPTANFSMYIDEQMLIQVIINLVKNSVEAIGNKADGQIDVYFTQLENKTVRIDVADNGPGIPDDVRDEIFVPFFTTKEGGTGVGLSYSRQIIRAHGGSISCKTRPGETIFSIII